MHIADLISRVLYVVSHALLVPIMLALLALLSGAVLQLGGFVGEMIQRARNGRVDVPLDGSPHRRAVVRRTRLVDRFLGATTLSGDSPAELRRRLRDCEADAARRLEGLQIISRLGPVLGLVGTLIPMGPALLSLATGDASTIGSNAVAFANTIVGLTSGGVAYVLLLIRRRWYAQDLSDIEFLYDVFTGETEGRADAVPAKD